MSRSTAPHARGSAPRLVMAPTATIAPGWYPTCHITYSRDTWVTLLKPLSDYADDSAKLLCPESPTTWVAWVPDHGEVILDRSHFYC